MRRSETIMTSLMLVAVTMSGLMLVFPNLGVA